MAMVIIRDIFLGKNLLISANKGLMPALGGNACDQCACYNRSDRF